MHLAPHMCKTKTLKVNTREIITVKCVWHQICTKSLLWRQMLGKSLPRNACGTTHVQTITLKANAKEIITWKWIWHQICPESLLWRQMLRKASLENAFDTTYVQNCYFAGKCQENHYLKMHLAPHMYKTITLKANAKEIVTWKCIWHQICTKWLLCREMPRASSLEHAFDTTYV